MSFDKESVYDEQISPLMTQIIAICKEHNIPMVAQFQYADTEDNGPAYVTTSLPIKDYASDHIREMGRRLQPPRPICIAETIATAPDGTTHITSRLVR